MQKISKTYRRLGSETGSVLLIVAASMVLLLAISAFAIDMANFYLARAQAQRAADAAALAGAKAFVTSGCTAQGCVQGGPQDTLARQMAESTGAQNYVAGQRANITDSDVVFNESNPAEPQVTVTVKRSVHTFFAKIFGIDTANVNAAATAEAYNPGSTGASQLGTSCLKPFLVPNCSPVIGPHGVNHNCADPNMGYFFYPGIPGATETLESDTTYSQGGVIGMPWQLHTEAAPSQWYLVGFPDSTWESGSALRNHIVECTSRIYTCGQTLQTANGVKEGDVRSGIETLIYASGVGLGKGQDSIDTNVTPGSPFLITGGSNNPNPDLRGQTFTDYSESPSVMTVPVYQGGTLTPGQDVVSVVGYLQVFVTQIEKKAIDMVILNPSTCGGLPGTGTGGSGSSTVVGSAGSPIPIRLIRTS